MKTLPLSPAKFGDRMVAKFMRSDQHSDEENESQDVDHVCRYSG